MPRSSFVLIACLVAGSAAATEPRARDLGIPFDGTPGPLNASTDVALEAAQEDEERSGKADDVAAERTRPCRTTKVKILLKKLQKT